MRLFGTVDGSIGRKDRAGWITMPFDLFFYRKRPVSSSTGLGTVAKTKGLRTVTGSKGLKTITGSKAIDSVTGSKALGSVEGTKGI